jgi:tetratricopeptide (TPR) repeat protein
MKKDGKRKRLRKRPHRENADKTALSMKLREIGDLIQRGRHADGLSKADAALANARLAKKDKSRVLAMVADSEFRLGRFEAAAQIQLKVAAATIDDPTLWLRAYIGEVRALLKSPNVEQAIMMADHAVAVAETKMADFNEKVRLAKQSVEEGGSVEVPPVPVRVSVVATRMGYLFLQEGEPEAAEALFTRAIGSTKGGANKARQGLAKIALARGEFGKAISMASDAIHRGGFKVKTLDAWKTLISARRQLCGWKIRERLIAGLDTVPAGLRARTILTIVRELRKNDMRQWRVVAKNWSQKEGRHFPIIETEIRKMTLASAKAEPGNATDKREKAEQLLQMPDLSAKEWLNGTKEFVRASLWEGNTVNFGQLIASAVSAYGEEFAPRARHSLALSCMMAKRHDLARPLLQENIQQNPYGNPMWAKSVWALARMESLLGDHAASAVFYRQFADEASISNKFRLQAQLLWCKELIAAGQPGPLLEARSMMEATLANVNDPDVLMNFARQLQYGPEVFRNWGAQLFEQGNAISRQRIADTTSPSEAISILFKLTRRQTDDFSRYEEVIAYWEGLNQDKRDWLWSERRVFWEYLGLVFKAYVRAGDAQRAEAFAYEFINDSATPPEGRAQIGIPYALFLVENDRISEALSLFTQLTKQVPTHPLSAFAWYWKALESHKCGRITERNRYCYCLRIAQGVNGGLLREWSFDAKAQLLLADLQVDGIDLQSVNYTAEFLNMLINEIQRNLGELP